MAITQSRTQVNSKASGAEPMQSVPTDVVPGQAREDIGGPTIYNYDSRNDSAAIQNKGTSQVHDQVNDKAGASSADGGGTGGKTLKGGQTTLPGGGSSAGYNGTADGRGKGNEPMPKLKKGAAYGTHVVVDDKANDTLDELADAQGASDDFKSKAKVKIQNDDGMYQSTEEVRKQRQELEAKFMDWASR